MRNRVTRSISLCLLIITMSPTFAAGWITSAVNQVGVQADSGCIYLDNAQVVKVDLTTEAGKAKFSLAVSALAADKSLRVYQNDRELVGGCNTGTTIKQHSIIRIIK